MAKEGRYLDIPADGGNNEGDGNGGDTDVNSPEAEYVSTIHCDAADYGPMQAGHPAIRHVGVSAVVETDEDRPEGSAREGVGSSCGNGSGFGVRGRSGRSRRKKRIGEVPGTERVKWSGVERSGAGGRG